MDKQQSRSTGEEFNQLARLLFDSASRMWYLSVGLEVGAGLLSVALSFLNASGVIALVGALLGVILLCTGYGLRLRFEDLNDTAETMRRQAAFTEGLDWPIDAMQATEWKRKVGREIRAKVRVVQRDPDYYNAKQPVGPRRLAEMTIESAFYTRENYCRFRTLMWWSFGIASVVTVLILLVTNSQLVPGELQLPLARAVYAFIPVVLSVNFLGWALRLNRLIANLRAVEADLRRHVQADDLTEEGMLRLVAEYNCQLIEGLPIHPRLWKRWHPEISEIWDNPFESLGAPDG